MILVSERRKVGLRDGIEPREALERQHDGAQAVRRELGTDPNAHHLFVVFGFIGWGDLMPVGAVHAATRAAADIARILARPHFGMPAAQRSNLFLQLDGPDSSSPPAPGDTNVDGARRNLTDVEVVGYRRSTWRDRRAQSQPKRCEDSDFASPGCRACTLARRHEDHPLVVHRGGNRSVVRSVPTMVFPVKPPSSTALR